MQMRLDRNRLRITREMAADGLSRPKKKKNDESAHAVDQASFSATTARLPEINKPLKATKPPMRQWPGTRLDIEGAVSERTEHLTRAGDMEELLFFSATMPSHTCLRCGDAWCKYP